MQADEKKSLSLSRIENAKECLSASKSLYKTGSYKIAANRAYYTIFHAMRAVLAFDGIDMKHHSGIISEFRRLYIKTKIFDSELSTIISALFDIRTDSDYDDFYVISKEEVKEQIDNAEFFLNSIEKFLSGIVNEK